MSERYCFRPGSWGSQWWVFDAVDDDMLVCESAVDRLNRQHDKIERLKANVQSWQDAHAVQEQRHKAKIKRLRDERNDARKAARWLYVESCRDPEEPVPPAEYFVVEKRWPWLEEVEGE